MASEYRKTKLIIEMFDSVSLFFKFMYFHNCEPFLQLIDTT